ncbi:MAG: hypothetical protein ACYTBJ_25460, partial [Planctomycetota bacterium]
MAGIEIKTDVDVHKTLERLRKGTGVVFTKFTKQIFRKVATKHRKRLLEDLEKYPRKRPGQKYVRTFRLRKGWAKKTRIRTPKTGGVLIVENDTPYTHFVVGKPDLRLRAGGKDQAWMHKGRWWLAGGVAKRHFRNLEKE